MHVRPLSEPSVICQSPGCGQVATVLVVSNVVQRAVARELIVACCERHHGEVIASVRLRYQLTPLPTQAAAATNL